MRRPHPLIGAAHQTRDPGVVPRDIVYRREAGEERRVEVEALVDAQAGLAEAGEAAAKGLVLPFKSPAFCIPSTSIQVWTARDSPHPARPGGLSIAGVRLITQRSLVLHCRQTAILH